MSEQEESSDLLILGSGPAGIAAALGGLQAGLSVQIVEAQPFPRHRPGESLHPGVEAVLDHLGAGSILREANYLRYPGIWTRPGPGQARVFQSFGSDERGTWLGYQAPGADLDLRLQRLAIARGAKCICCKATDVLLEGERVLGVRTDTGRELRATYTLDATGGRSWLSGKLAIAVTKYSPRLVVRTGYVAYGQTACQWQGAPSIEFDNTGWIWVARVSDKLLCWNRLSWSSRGASQLPPVELQGLATEGAVRGADMTWRCAETMAGRGFFLLGDAAAVLDAGSSQGVLRALLSGAMAAGLAARTLRGEASEEETSKSYELGMKMRFYESRGTLARLYAELPGAPNWLSLTHSTAQPSALH